MASALTHSLKLPVSRPSPTPPRSASRTTSVQFQLPRVDNPFPLTTTLKITRPRIRNGVVFMCNAVEEGQESAESEAEAGEGEMGELGAEIKAAMMERKRREEEGKVEGLWGGVAEEISEIEWPAFKKVLGTTGLVLGVIAGSSVVLLTVNAVLAELSDRVFAGRGLQDFFS